MAGSVNKVILIGNLGADPEIRRTQDGRPVANLRLATSESWKDKNTGRAQGKDRVAPRRHLQREPVPDRRAIPEEGLESLHRGRAADAQMAGPVRPGQLFDRSGAARFSRRADVARLARQRERGWRQRAGRRRQQRLRFSGPDPQGGGGRDRGRRPRRRYGRRNSVLRTRHSAARSCASPESIVTALGCCLRAQGLWIADFAASRRSGMTESTNP